MAETKVGSTGSQDVPQRIDAARRGSRDALGQLFEGCRDYLLLVANCELDAALRAKGGASDVVQETFLKAHQAFGNFEGSSEAELLAWLRKILRNNLANLRRDYETGKRRLSREVALELGNSGEDQIRRDIAADNETPSAQAMAEEQSDALDHALGRLPEDYRKVIELRHCESRSFAEIGQAMDRSPDAARKLWSRAIERLTQELENRR